MKKVISIVKKKKKFLDELEKVNKSIFRDIIQCPNVDDVILRVVNEMTLMIMLKLFLYFCLIFNQIDIPH